MVKKLKYIPVSVYSEQVSIYVSVRRKQKLTDLYPQRAILEESRKQSSLIQANDWIDHSYYENMVEKSSQVNRRLDKKYGPKMPRHNKDLVNPEIKVHKIKDITEY